MKQPPAAADRAVAVRGDVVVKIQSPERSRWEYRRTLAGRAVSEATGLFVVPAIIAFDDSRGEIVFERLALAPLLENPAEHARNLELVGRAATALAAIHRHLETADDVPAAAPTEQGTVTDGTVPLHGDFGLRNVMYVPSSDRIAIIDWANAEWLGAVIDRGIPEVDLAVFLVSLFHRRLFTGWPIARRRAIAHHFLETYASASPQGVNTARLTAVVAANLPRLHQLVRRSKGVVRALGYRHGMVDLRLFLRGL